MVVFRKSLYLCIISCIIAGTPCLAQQSGTHMTGRLGVGANVAMSGAMGMSARYWLNDLVAVEGIFNFTNMDQGDTSNRYFVIAGRGMYSLFDYGSVHGCVGAGLALGNTEIDYGTTSNDQNFLGLEFFFLVEQMMNQYFSISGQTGITYINADDSTVLSVGTPSVIGLFGFHFYL